MGLDFLQHYGGRRVQQYIEQPPLESSDEDDVEKAKVNLDYERTAEDWEARSVISEHIDPAALPSRFIDGCHYGTTVAHLEVLTHPHPIPIRLAEVGGVSMRIEGRSLRREFSHLERIVCAIVDPFPWHEVESFAVALEEIGMRLLPVKLEEALQSTADYGSMVQWTYTRAQDAMRVLEELALDQDPETLTLVDGPLMWKAHPWAIGVVKQHRENYLHSRGWKVFYALEPGERTPAFQLSSPRPRVSWFLKLDGAHGAMPNWGVVRVEISCDHFERCGKDSGYLDRLSNALLHLRCRQKSYARAPVSMEPIVRAEESLKSLFTFPVSLAQRFYHLTGM